MINQEVFLITLTKWAKEQGASGIGLFYYRAKEKISGKGPVGKFFSEESIKEIMKISKQILTIVFFSCGKI